MNTPKYQKDIEGIQRRHVARLGDYYSRRFLGLPESDGDRMSDILRALQDDAKIVSKHAQRHGIPLSSITDAKVIRKAE